MTNATSKVLEHYLNSHLFSYLTTTTSLMAVALLIVVAAEREILRATAGEGPRRDLAAFAIVVLPMVVVFIAVVIARFLRLSNA